MLVVFYQVIWLKENLIRAGLAVCWNFVTSISWNVLAMFTGISVVAHLFIESKVPAWLADWFVERSKTVSVALLAICALASFILAFVDNISTVLIVAPIAVAICQRLQISPVTCLIGLAISSNLQGTATLIGVRPA